jgi:hypothetical protein
MKSFHRRSARPAPEHAAKVRPAPERHGRVRIDALLVQRLIDADVVLLDGQPVTRSSQTVAADCCIALRTED